MDELQRTGLAGVAIVLVSVYLFDYTSLLGPYGSANDIYHQIIFVATLFGLYLVVQFTLLRRRRAKVE